MSKKTIPAKDTPLIPISEFKEIAKTVLNTPKKENDEQLATFQASNAAKRDARKSRKKQTQNPV